MIADSSRLSDPAEALTVGHIILQFGKGLVEGLDAGCLEDFGKVLNVVIRKRIVLMVTNSHDGVSDCR